MRLFWQRLNRSKAIEKSSAPALEIVRRVEITVEEDWISGVVRVPSGNTSDPPPDGEQRIVSYSKLPPPAEGK